MCNGLEIKALKQLITELEMNYDNYNNDYDKDIDYDLLRKDIYEIERNIKDIVMDWEIE